MPLIALKIILTLWLFRNEKSIQQYVECFRRCRQNHADYLSTLYLWSVLVRSDQRELRCLGLVFREDIHLELALIFLHSNNCRFKLQVVGDSSFVLLPSAGARKRENTVLL